MASMIHSRSYNPVLFQKIRVSTELYGVNCKVYNPVNMETGFMSYSEVEYADMPFTQQKLLIPKIVINRNGNSFTEMAFLEEECFLWSTVELPRFSKVVPDELSELFSFIISDINTTIDPRGIAKMYFKYTLVPSSSVTSSDQARLDTIAAKEEIRVADPAFESSISDVNKVSTNTPSTSIKVGKL